MSTVIKSGSAVARSAIDVLLDVYLSWREECAAVGLAYQRWVDSERFESGLAYAGYVAALEREEHAACTYASQVARVSRMYA